MVTLTYRPDEEYEPGDIGQYLNRLRGMLKDELLGWAWVAELQKRGVIHYHVMIFFDRSVRVPMPDKHGHWEKGMSKVQEGTSPYYLIKYAGKGKQKDLERYPKGARLYGVSVRFGGDDMKLVYRYKAGLLEFEDSETSDYKFIGASVTETYAKNVIAGIID
jgi:hypothetical protein